MIPNRFGVVLELAAKYGKPAASDDEARRAFVRKVVETLVALFPGELWGTKRAGAGRPLSKDVICTQHPFEGVDIQTSGGDLVWNEHNASTDPNWAAQEPYFETFPGVNWLADVPPSTGGPGTVTQPPAAGEPGIDLAGLMQPVIERLDAILASNLAAVSAITKAAAEIKAGVKIRF